MIEDLLAEYGSEMSDVPVCLHTEIERTQNSVGADNELVHSTIDAVNKYTGTKEVIRKSELLKLWKSGEPFASKCLATIWWGHPDARESKNIYSEENLEKLQDTCIETEFNHLHKEEDIDKFEHGLKTLFQKFERGGDYHLDYINTSFFTKLFHFYFEAFPPASGDNLKPIVADKWMKHAMYAEMMDEGNSSRKKVFDVIYPGKECSIDFHYSKGTAANSYIDFLRFFNCKVESFKKKYPNLTAFILEDIIFNHSKDITPLYLLDDCGGIFLAPWISGRYNAQAKAAIIFNNILGESYLFEDDSAELIGKILEYEYENPLDGGKISESIGCTRAQLYSFFHDLIREYILLKGKPDEKYIRSLRDKSRNLKKRTLKKSKGTENLQSIFELADTDYSDKIGKQNIPSSVSFELTYGCNEKCIHCYNPNSSREECLAKKTSPDELELKDYISVLDQLAEMGVPKVLFTGGDPFIKKDFMKILEYAHKKKFAISIYTNGQAIDDKTKYEQVINLYPYQMGLSLYSTDPSVHESITRTPGSCQKTISVAKKLSNDGVCLLVKCPIMKANKDSYREVQDFALENNSTPEIDVNITSGTEGDTYAVNNLRLSEEEMEEVLKDPTIPLSPERKNASRAMDRKPEMQFCGAGISGANIQPDGTVTPCIAFALKCGNVKERPFADIWNNSPELKRVRELTYGDSDKCGKESYCKWCNRCIGQSYTEKGIPENYSTDNCFIAKIREKISNQNKA